MKKWKLHLLSLVLALMTFAVADAQPYQAAIGARLGYPLSASLKSFITETSAVEVYAGFRGWSNYRWFSVNGAYQVHFPIEGIENLSWYVGGGAGIYFWSYDFVFDNNDSDVVLGIQGYLGLDYRLEEIPLNLTLDWVPAIFLSGYRNGFRGTYGNLGARYVFK